MNKLSNNTQSNLISEQDISKVKEFLVNIDKTISKKNNHEKQDLLRFLNQEMDALLVYIKSNKVNL